MLDFIQQYLTGEEWEKLCNSCYRMKYQEEGYQEFVQEMMAGRWN